MTTSERALRLGIVLVGLQAALALAAYFQVHRMALAHTVRVYAEAAPLPGATWPVRVSVIDEAARRPAAWDSAELVARTPEGREARVALAPDGGATSEAVANVLALSLPSEIEVHVEGAGSEALRVSGRVSDAAWPHALASDDALSRSSTQRRPDLGGEGDQPRVWVRRASDACPMVLSVVANGGVVARDLDNRVWLRLTHPDGAPAAGVALEIQPHDAGDPAPEAPAPTDTLGVAEVALRPLVAGSWSVRWSCGGVQAERRVSWVPSWDGIVLQMHSPHVPFGRSLTLEASHQRGFGRWYVDVRCDGRWTMTGSEAVEQGTRRMSLPLGLGEPAPHPLWCTVSGTTIPLSPDPPRGQTHALILPAGASLTEVLGEVAGAYRAHAPDPIAQQLEPPTLAALERASQEELDRFASWLVHAMPYVYEPPPLWTDSGPAAREALAATRAGRLRALAVTLAVDFAVLLAFVLGIVLPRARRERAQLESLYAGELVSGAPATRPWLVLALGVGVLVASGLGIVALLSVLG